MCVLKNHLVIMNIMHVNSVLYRTEKITTKSTTEICNFRKKILFKIRNIGKRNYKEAAKGKML